MKVFNAGDPTYAHKFRNPMGSTTLEGWEGRLPPVGPVLITGPAAPQKRAELTMQMRPGAKRRAVILVHGFNSSKERVEQAYSQIVTKIYEDPSYQIGTEVVGYRWPSDGSPFKYFSDLKDAAEAALPLIRLVRELRREYGAEEIHIVAHSMGGEVAMAALRFASVGMIDTITLLGADIDASQMCHGKEWGQHQLKVKALHVYYSASDDVLGFWARLVPGRGFRRLGQIGLPAKNVPRNFYNWNAESLQQAPVFHDTYRSSDKILHTVQLGWGFEAIKGENK